MFDLVDRPRLWIPVQWPGLMPGPGDEIAVPVVNEIEMFVEIVDKEEYREIFGFDDDGTPNGRAWDALKACKRLCSNWRKVAENKQPVPYSEERLASLCSFAGFTNGFSDAYTMAFNGRVAEREKNFDSSPNIGRADDQSNEIAPVKS